MAGLFVTFEGTEGSGKSTQIQLLAKRIEGVGRKVISLREPGGTPIGEEIRHTLKHSAANTGMCAETELLLMNASRAQLVREVIKPALEENKVVLCDRFFDSTFAYQVHGRGLDALQVQRVIDVAIGGTIPHLTLLLRVPIEVSENRRATREVQASEKRDRFEEQDREFFKRVEQGYDSIAASTDTRVRSIDATRSVEEVHEEIWRWVESLICTPSTEGERAWKTIGEYRTSGPG
ncbi:MAG TPA: dTMP kinase [Verrucomicrobiae bacterium]